MDPVFVLKLKVNTLIIGINIGVSESTLSDSLDHGKISFAQSYMLIVELIKDFGPPLFVILAFHKLF